MRARPRVAVLTTAWGDEASEAYFVTRQVAGALAGAADVDIVALGGESSGTRSDGAFPVHSVATTPVLALRTRLLMTALQAGAGPAGGTAGAGPAGGTAGARLPRGAEDELRHLNGGAGDQVAECLDHLDPDAVLVAGFRQGGDRSDVARLGEGRRLVLLALAGSDDQLWLPVYDPLFGAADAVLSVTEPEDAELARRLGPRGRARLAHVGVALRVTPSPAPPAETAVRPFLLVLAGWPPGVTAADGAATGRHLAARLGVATVTVEEHATTVMGGRSPRRWPATSRADLWRLMSSAAATVDLRPQQLIGREAIESMLLATPVIVPEGTIATHHAESSGGGLWFRSRAELLECARTVLAPEMAAALGERARQHAAAHLGDTAGMVERVRAAVLQGAETPAGPPRP